MASIASTYSELPSGFLFDVEATGARLGIDPHWMMAVMDFETGGSFSPSERNPYSGFVGLIQFGPAAAADLGTTTGALAGMSRAQQLGYVEDYFSMRQRQHGALRSIEDVYMAVLLPTAIGKSNDHVLFRRPSTRYAQNSGLDASGDGTVTKREAAAPVRRCAGGSAAASAAVSAAAWMRGVSGSSFLPAASAWLRPRSTFVHRLHPLSTYDFMRQPQQTNSGLAGWSEKHRSGLSGGLGYDPVQQLCDELGIPQGIPCNCETISSIAGPCTDVTRRVCTDRYARSVEQGLCCPSGGYVGDDCPHPQPSPGPGGGGAFQAGFMDGPMPWILGSAVAGTVVLTLINK